VRKVLERYDMQNLTIGVLGGHSALDVCRGAKRLGMRTLVVCQKGREQTYTRHYKARGDKGVVDDVLVLDSFADIVQPNVQEELRKRNTIFIHNRYFWVYCDFTRIEREFLVPIFGTRHMLKLEERNVPGNQYELLAASGIRFPRIFRSAKEIDRLAIVKVNEAQRGYERAFFLAQGESDFARKAQELLAKGTITEQGLAAAVIEEYVVGAQVNFNYFHSVVDGELELMGTDMRRQTNLDGILRLPADEQLELLRYVRPKMIETGHVACTTKESILEQVFAIGERFVKATQERCPPGIIGPFALQGAIAAEDGKEVIVVFDVSMRIPGSPLTMFTPYSGYLHREQLSYGDRIAMEIAAARDRKMLNRICT
jgi:5-formaminoimidazole-4-carboxamide-1-(beta)-D-ribofuranosyl 5'-monophosphate synthetase